MYNMRSEIYGFVESGSINDIGMINCKSRVRRFLEQRDIVLYFYSTRVSCCILGSSILRD